MCTTIHRILRGVANAGKIGARLGGPGALERRPVPNGEERLREAAKQGFKRAIIPRANAPRKGLLKDMVIQPVTRLSEVLDSV